LKRKRAGIASGPVEILLHKVDRIERISFGEKLRSDGRSNGSLLELCDWDWFGVEEQKTDSK